MTAMPILGVFSKADYTEKSMRFQLSDLGGLIGAGVEIQRRRVGFHATLCGGYFSEVRAYTCGRVSTRGWIGLDINGALAPPITLQDVFTKIGDFWDGLYYMG